jgi:hypothetical protein
MWATSVVGYYPWYLTYNFLDARVSNPPAGLTRHARNGVIGLACSLVSDTCTNSIRVLKTVKQTSPTPISYMEAAESVIATGGLGGLFVRGLALKLVSNGISCIIFTIMWKYLMSVMKERREAAEAKERADAISKEKKGRRSGMTVGMKLWLVAFFFFCLIWAVWQSVVSAADEPDRPPSAIAPWAYRGDEKPDRLTGM